MHSRLPSLQKDSASMHFFGTGIPSYAITTVAGYDDLCDVHVDVLRFLHFSLSLRRPPDWLKACATLLIVQRIGVFSS